MHLLVCSDDILPFSLNEISLSLFLFFLFQLLYFFSSHRRPEGQFLPAATQRNNLNPR